MLGIKNRFAVCPISFNYCPIILPTKLRLVSDSAPASAVKELLENAVDGAIGNQTVGE
jgi:hypothetical protein